MADRLAVSVIIATHNGAGVLPLQLAALETQVGAPPFEVIVVDNRSTDGTSAVVAQWAGRLELRYVYAPDHQGTSYARNVGIAQARADKIAFCNDDDCVGAWWVRQAAASLDEAEFVTGKVVDLPETAFTDVESVRQLVGDSATYRPPHPEPGFDTYPVLMGGNSALRRALALQLGGFDQRFFPGAEDNDLALRYVRGGGTLLRAPSMIVAARMRGTPAAAAARAFAGGRMHLLLCAVHDLWQASPHIARPDFRADLVRALVAWASLPLRRKADRSGVRSRLALRRGQFVGWLRFAVLRLIPEAQLGVGLDWPRDDGD